MFKRNVQMMTRMLYNSDTSLQIVSIFCIVDCMNLYVYLNYCFICKLLTSVSIRAWLCLSFIFLHSKLKPVIIFYWLKISVAISKFTCGLGLIIFLLRNFRKFLNFYFILFCKYYKSKFVSKFFCVSIILQIWQLFHMKSIIY